MGNYGVGSGWENFHRPRESPGCKTVGKALKQRCRDLKFRVCYDASGVWRDAPG